MPRIDDAMRAIKLIWQRFGGKKVTKQFSKFVDYILRKLSDTTTPQQELVAYARRSPRQRSMDYREAEVINRMQLVGMQELRAVTCFTMKRDMLEKKLINELLAKRLPQAAVDAITAEIDGVTAYSSAIEDFVVDSAGTGSIFKAVIKMKLDPQDNGSMQFAMAVSGAKFDAAREVEHYEEEEVPIFKEATNWEPRSESGTFWGTKTKLVQTTHHVLVGSRKKRTPVFKQKTFTKADLEIVRQFLEEKTNAEVLQLHGEGLGDVVPSGPVRSKL